MKEAKRTGQTKRWAMGTLLLSVISLGLLPGCTISDTLLSALAESASTVLDAGLADILESLTTSTTSE